MLQRFIILVVLLFVPCVTNACVRYPIYRPANAHVIRDNRVALHPVAKHPVQLRRVATARRNRRM